MFSTFLVHFKHVINRYKTCTIYTPLLFVIKELGKDKVLRNASNLKQADDIYKTCYLNKGMKSEEKKEVRRKESKQQIEIKLMNIQGLSKHKVTEIENLVKHQNIIMFNRNTREN